MKDFLIPKPPNSITIDSALLWEQITERTFDINNPNIVNDVINLEICLFKMPELKKLLGEAKMNNDLLVRIRAICINKALDMKANGEIE